MIRYTILLPVMVLSIFLISIAQAQSRFLIDSTSLHPKITIGETANTFRIYFSNIGDSILVITNIRTDGMVGSANKPSYQPGEKGWIELKFHPYYKWAGQWKYRSLGITTNAEPGIEHRYMVSIKVEPISPNEMVQRLAKDTKLLDTMLVPTIEKLTDSLFIIKTYMILNGKPFPASSLVAITSAGTILIDAGFDSSQANLILEWLSLNGNSPRYCFVTHAHNDRSGGLPAYKGLTVLYSNRTAGELQRLYKQHYQYTPIDDDETFVFGDTKFQCFYPGPGHSPDNIVIYLPKYNLLYGGCFIKEAAARDLGNLADADVKQWKRSIQKVIKRFPKPKIVIPGHGDWKDPSSLKHTVTLIKKQLP